MKVKDQELFSHDGTVNTANIKSKSIYHEGKDQWLNAMSAKKALKVCGNPTY